MFTTEQQAQIAAKFINHLDLIFFAFASLIVALLGLLTRAVNGIKREVKGSRKSRKEIQENLRRVANGRSVHHETEGEGAQPGA